MTDGKIFADPTPIPTAVAAVQAWLDSGTLTLLAEDAGAWAALRQVLDGSGAVGPQVHDARIAAICAADHVRELWTADRDFDRFPGLAIHNPLI